MHIQSTNKTYRDPKIDGEVRRGAIRRMAQVAIIILIQALVLFITAGRLDWVAAWMYLGAYLGIVIVNTLVLLPRSPELIAERGA